MSKALLRYIRLSPTKARLIAREIQGMNAELAIASLEFTPNKAARIISKVLASAVANGGYDTQEVVVLSCRIDAGPVLRRFMPRAKGRATPIRKPTSHVFVEVGIPKDSAKKTKGAKKVVGAQKISKATSTKSEISESRPKQEKAKVTESKPTKKAITKSTAAKASKTTEGEGK